MGTERKQTLGLNERRRKKETLFSMEEDKTLTFRNKGLPIRKVKKSIERRNSPFSS